MANDIGQSLGNSQRLRVSQNEAYALARDISAGIGAPSSLLLVQPAHPHFSNLPMPLTSLIGREREQKMACALLTRSEIRLLTMTGAGGIGKTRLALACASEIQPSFRDGVCLVRLASLTDSDQVIPALLQTLGIKEHYSLSPIASLQRVLREKQMLLILDNFEHLLDAAPLLLSLLQDCPKLKMLVTSRALLHVTGERAFPVPPLAVPAPQTSGVALFANASMTLFVERASALKPDFQVTEATAPVLAELCRQLDGLPLALELAAVRIRLLSPQQLLARLAHRLDLLVSPDKALSTRQQTMRLTIKWSYDLLTPREQMLFCRLCVFVGGCQLSDVVALYAHLGDDPGWVLDGVTSLLDKSLLFVKEEARGEPRLEMLETIREFSQEMLLAHGELENTRKHHAHLFAALVPLPEPAQLGLAQGAWLARLKQDYQNLLTALRFFLENNDTKQALQLAVGMGGIWFVNGYGSLGQEEMERLLTHPHFDQNQVPPDLCAMGYILTGRISIDNADLISAIRWYRKSLAIARTLPDFRLLALTIGGLVFAEGDLGNYAEVNALRAEDLPVLRQVKEQGVFGRVLMCSSVSWLHQGNLERARAEAEECIQPLRTTSGQSWTLACALHVVGWIDYLEGKFASAHASGQEGITIFRQLGFPVLGLEALAAFAYETAAIGDQETAQALLEEDLILSQETGDLAEVARAHCGLGYLALQRDDLTGARLLFEECIAILSQIRPLPTRYMHIFASSLEGLAVVALADGQALQASRLLGAADALRHIGGTFCPLGRMSHLWEKTRKGTQETLGDATFTNAFVEGGRIAPLQTLVTIEPGRGTYKQTPNEAHTSTHVALFSQGAMELPSGEHLTRREVEVLRLLAQGLSNAQIAEQLAVSRVTVNAFLRSLYGKLGVSSRTRAIRYALDQHWLS